MSIARRSPGSALKPFIYGLAFEEGLVMPETLIADRPADFAGYRPRNFDMTFQGDVNIREALQLSLNVPAVRLLDGVGPARLTALLRRGQADYALARDGRPGLSIGLGGIGISLVDLVQLYTGLASVDGRPLLLVNGVDGSEEAVRGQRLLENTARWHVTDILRGVAPPVGADTRNIAYKTGTSYGYRDAWSVGYDGRYVIGVWVGRADNTVVPGMTDRSSAAPVLFDAFARFGLDPVPFRPAPAGAVRLAREDLPPAMRRYETLETAMERHEGGEAPPHIAYPPNGARVEVGRRADASLAPLVVKLQGGRTPLRWLANAGRWTGRRADGSCIGCPRGSAMPAWWTSTPPAVRPAPTSLSNSVMIPPSLRWLADKPGGAGWLEQLPDLLGAVCEDWDLQPDGGELNGNLSYAIPVRQQTRRFALKLQWPHEECLHEAGALRQWGGDGAVRLTDHDANRHALLLEWCEPGVTIAVAKPADPIGIVADLLRRLSVPADVPFRSLADEASAWGPPASTMNGSKQANRASVRWRI